MATVQPKTPGVYVYEPDSFPPSIVGVGTAIPAFIGYTETGFPVGGARPVAVRITSLVEYRAAFGGPYLEQFYVKAVVSGSEVAATERSVGKFSLGSATYDVLETPDAQFNLYSSLTMFFANGGSECYIVSCGPYEAAPGQPSTVKKSDLSAGLLGVTDVVGPTILVIPDATLLSGTDGKSQDFDDICVEMLRQCLYMQDRVAILDVWTDAAEEADPSLFPQKAISGFRDGMAGAPREALRYGMAYFPYILTSTVSPDDVTVASFSEGKLTSITDAITAYAKEIYAAGSADLALVETYVTALTDKSWKAPVAPTDMNATQLTAALNAALPGLKSMFSLIAASQNILPPSGAMAGIYAQNDRDKGVWNAPANVGIAGAVAPVTNISDDQQADMNVPVNGLAINAIRTFVNRGTLVWGARTLDGNSNDWRYIQVRRTMIYVEQSVKGALNNVVFAPNTAQTWVTVVSMVESFLHGVWSAGGLAGSSPAAAYSVQCGLGTTMTSEDVNNGIMIVQVVLTTVHPAEFIELVFKQKMMGGA